jgi:hypothetical protein
MVAAVMAKPFAVFIALIISMACVNRVEALQLVEAKSGSCMNLPEHGGSAADGTQVRLFHCHDTSNQAWSVSNGQILASFGACLDVQGSAPSEGAHIVIVTCNGHASQKWNITNGQIVGRGGKCVDVQGGSTQDTARLILASCSAAPSQQWTIQ